MTTCHGDTRAHSIVGKENDSVQPTIRFKSSQLELPPLHALSTHTVNGRTEPVIAICLGTTSKHAHGLRASR